MAENEKGLRKETFFATVRVYLLYARISGEFSLIPICMRDPYFDNEEVQNLFDSSGFWIAFRIGRNIFDTVGNWVGWMPFDTSEVHSTRGPYLGHIYPGNRLYRNTMYLKRESIEKPISPRYIPHQPFPGNMPRAQLPIGAQDLRLSAHV